MKSFIFIISLVIIETVSALGQNYIGMDQNKIIKRFGEPDEIGSNYIIYNDLFEQGTNTYYFDQNEKCVSFVIERNNNYLKEYRRILNTEFFKLSDTKFQKRQNHLNLSAEINQSENNFKILIKTEEIDLSSLKITGLGKIYSVN